MKSTISNPGPALWSCCKAAPTKVISFEDGTAVVACTPCTGTVPQGRVHPLPWAEDQVVVVFDVTGPDPEARHRLIHTLLRMADVTGTVSPDGTSRLESWWMPSAEGRALDGNDNAEMHLVPVPQ